MQRARKDYKKIKHGFNTIIAMQCNHFICSMLPLSELFFLIIEQSILMVLVFYEKCMLEKVTMQKTQIFLCYRKNPAKCRACVVSSKTATECGIAFSEIHLFFENQSEFNEIWQMIW